MELKELKTKLKENKIDFKLSFIFTSDDFYLPLSYISYLKDTLNYSINYIDKITIQDSMFFNDEKELKVIDVMIIDKLDNLIKLPDNTIIITKKIGKDIIETFSDRIIEFPKLENWQIEDYIKVLGKGIKENNIKWLLDITNYNINRIDMELKKINIFPEKSRNSIFELLKQDNNFYDLTPFDIFSLSNSLIVKDKEELSYILKDIDNLDMNIIGFLTILYNNFKAISNIQLGINPTPEKLNMSIKQFAALKYRINKYKNDQLIKILDLLSAIDYKLKAGLIPADLLINYIILKVINCI